MTHAASPTLHTDDRVADIEDAKVHCVLDTPLQPTVDVLLPRRLVEVWLRFVKEERIDAAVKMRVLRVHISLFYFKGKQARTFAAFALRVTMMIGHTGRYLETKRAVVPLHLVSTSECSMNGSRT